MATLRIRQNDNNLTRYLRCKNADGTYVDLSSVSQVRFHAGYMGDPASYVIDKVCAVVDGENGRVSVTFEDEDLDEFGTYAAELQTSWPDGTILTIPTKGSQFRIQIDGEVK